MVWRTTGTTLAIEINGNIVIGKSRRDVMHRSPHHGLFGGRRGPEDPSARESRGVTLSLELLHLLLHFELKGRNS